MAEPTRVVLAGAGRFGALHARVWTEAGAHVAAVVDIDPGRATAVARDVSAELSGTDLPAALAQAGADVLVIASEETSHAALARQGLDAGCHVFIEKPFALDPREAADIVRRAESRHLVAFAGHISRFAQPYAYIREALTGGRLGTLWSMRLRRDFSRSWWADFGDRVHPVWESGIHDIDLAIHFAASRPTRVVAVTSRAAGPAAPSVLSALLTFDSGVTATIEFAWAVPTAAPTTLAGALALDGTIAAECEIIGSAGIVKQRLVNDAVTEWTDQRSLAPDLSLWPERDGRIGGALRDEVHEALAVFRSEREPLLMPHREAVWGVQVAAAIEESTATGRPVDLAEPVPETR